MLKNLLHKHPSSPVTSRFCGWLVLCRVDMIHDPVWCATLLSVLLLDIHGFCLHLRRLTLTLRKHSERDTFSTDGLCGVQSGCLWGKRMLMETSNRWLLSLKTIQETFQNVAWVHKRQLHCCSEMTRGDLGRWLIWTSCWVRQNW